MLAQIVTSVWNMLNAKKKNENFLKIQQEE